MIQRKVQTQGAPDGEGHSPASGISAAGPFSPGSIIGGKYLVEDVIGEGGLGVVVRAKHLQLDQPVAIKHLKPLAVSHGAVVERFMREARLAAKIKTEHAVKVHDVDAVESGVPYMVMELLEGRDLDQVVSQSPLPIDVAIDYVLQACEALAEAHAAGIVHRDLKPANLFLASRPGNSSIVKVLDFGISKLASQDRSDRRVTRIDERVGTPVFMSPEQLQAAPDVDARSDIWSLGVVLFELVTGKLPFDAPDLPQLCVAILTKPPVPLAVLHADAPDELDAVITRCLQKDRSKRYQNIAELAQDLAQIWQGDSPSRVMQIARVIGEAGQKISPPTPFPGSIEIPALTPTRTSTSTSVSTSTSSASSRPPTAVVVDGDEAPLDPAVAADDPVVAVFSDAAGVEVDEMQFVSIDEAYEYAASLEDGIVRCDLYDEFAGVRGRLRVTYLRKPETGHWVPLLPR